MRRPQLFRSRGVAVLALFLAASSAGSAALGQPPALTQAPPATAQGSIEALDESGWITFETLRQIAVSLARAGRPAADIALFWVTPEALELRVASETWAVSRPPVGLHLWSPARFDAAVRSLLKVWKLSPAADRAQASALEALIDPRAEVLVDQNRRISDWLERDPLSAAAHEQAALLLAAFSLREAAGPWSDTREALCGVSAHLAIARALRGQAQPSAAGWYADVALEVLVGRERPALSRLSERAPQEGAAQAWSAALRDRSSHDWRQSSDRDRGSLLEQLAHFRVQLRGRGPTEGLRVFRSRPRAPIPDWGFLALERWVPVVAGNDFVPPLLASLEQETSSVWRAVSGDSAPEPAWPVLARPLERGRTDVLPWRLWAGFYERHALQAAQVTDRFYSRTQGFASQGPELRAQLIQELRWLPRANLLEASWVFDRASWGRSAPTRDQTQQACAQITARAQSVPQELPALLWDAAATSCFLRPPATPLRAVDSWFAGVFPFGTFYDADSRMRTKRLLMSLGPSGAEIVHPLIVCDLMIETFRAKRLPTSAVVREACPEASEFDGDVLRSLAALEQKEGSTELRARRLLCQVSSTECLPLGEQLAALRRDQEAAEAFQSAIDGGADPIAVSAIVGFLVDYEFDRGHEDRARQFANLGAQTGSAVGLETLARWQERVGQYPQAEATYRRLAERYEDPRQLQAFQIRRAQRSGADVAALAGSLFPEGLKKVTVADFPAPDPAYIPYPLYIVEPAGLHPELERFGVRVGDGIVAVDGYRVANFEQYRCVRSFTDESPMKLILFRSGSVLELSGDYRRPQFGPRVKP